MSFQIICNTDHPLGGTKAGAVIFESLDNAADGERALRFQRGISPSCELSLLTFPSAEVNK